MLKINNLVKGFNLNEAEELQKIAVDNVSVTINDGDFVTIIGGNGSGKSTFFNLISGVHEPDSGSIVLDGIDITNLKEHKRAAYLGRVFQDPIVGTAGELSVIENMYLARKKGLKRSLKWSFNKRSEDEFISMLASLNLGLEDFGNKKIKLLSGGQRQAITLLMAIMNKPKLLLLDEHTAALDPKTANNVLSLTEKVVTEQNITTIMITHNISDAIKYGNRLIMFKDGVITFDVSGKEKENLKLIDVLSLFNE